MEFSSHKDKKMIDTSLAYLYTKFPFIFRRTFWRDTFRRIKRFVQPEDFLLDVGAREAPYTRYLPNRTIITDIAQEGRMGFSRETLSSIQSSQRNLTPVYASAEALPFANDTFDKIICTEVIEHIANDADGVSEMARVLKPSGQIFVTTPNGEKRPLESDIEEHIRHYTENDLKELFCRYFESVLVERRFHFIWMLEMQAGPPQQPGSLILRLYSDLTGTVFAWFCDLIYLIERLLRLDGNFNICVVATQPRKAVSAE